MKIAAIEQQTQFREELPTGAVIGIELGADVAANVDLDEFMVFEQNEDRARAFFRGLLFKHVTAGGESDAERTEIAILRGRGEGDLVSQGFTDRRALDELVRAAEGVPRDAINIAARAALRAGPRQIPSPTFVLRLARGSRTTRRPHSGAETKRSVYSTGSSTR